MKKLILFPFLLILCSFLAFAYGEYGSGTYDDGTFGSGTPEPPAPATTSSGGGGGSSGGSGGGVSAVKFKSNEPRQFNMRKNNPIGFRINGYTHKMKVTFIGSTFVSYRVESEPQVFDLKEGETKKLDFDDDKVYDLQVTLKDITSYNAVTIIERITESYDVKTTKPAEVIVDDIDDPVIIGDDVVDKVLEPLDKEVIIVPEPESKFPTGIVVCSGIIAIGLIIYYIAKKKRREKPKV